MMKQVHLMMLAILAAAAVASAQAPQSQAKPQTQPEQKQGAQGAAPPPAPLPKNVLMAKTKEEFQAYNEASSKTDAAAAEAAANDFAAKFPDSNLRAYLYQRVMALYQSAGNDEKELEVGRKALQIQPDNPVALVGVANVLANRTRESDLDRDVKLAEATRDATRALETVDTDLLIPPNTPAERVEKYKSLLRSMCYSSLGLIELHKKDYAAAEGYLRKSIEADKPQPDPVTRLQLAVALDRLGKYQDALGVTQECLQIPDNPVAERCRMEQDRLQKLVEAATPGAATPAATPDETPAAPSTVPAPAPKPQNPPSPGR
jgi:tetratricopeptide (TPR) repeat protein